MESILLTIGFVGLVLALLTPFTKLSTLLTLASFSIYFYLSGIENWLPLLLFVLGLLLIVFEIVVPEFGVAGILGLILLISGLYWTIGDLWQVIRDLSLAVLITTTLVIYLVKKGYSLKNVKKLVLQTNLASTIEIETKEQTVRLEPGLIGQAQTPLRPSGKATFGDQGGPMYDVLSVESLIQTGTPVIIEKIQGSKILVREYKKEDGR